MKERESVNRCISWAIALAWIMFFVGPQAIQGFQTVEKRHQPTLARDVAQAKANAILKRALANPHYSADTFQHDIRERLDRLAICGNIRVENVKQQLRDHVHRCNDIFANRAAYNRWLNSPEGQAAYTKGGVYEPVSLAIDWKWLGLQYLWFCLPMFFAFASRAFTCSKSLSEGLARLWVTRSSLAVCTLFWFIGCTAYEPDNTWQEVVEEAAINLRRIRGLGLHPKVGRPTINVDQLCVLSPGRSIWCVLRYVWGPLDKTWYRLLMVWKQPVAKAIAISLFASLMIAMTGTRVAAEDTPTKEVQPTASPLTGLIWVQVAPLINGAPPGNHLFLDFQGGWEVVAYGYDSNQPDLEFSKVWKLPIKRWHLDIGPYVAYSSSTHKLTNAGIYGHIGVPIGNGKLMGPFYLGQSPTGMRSFLAPNLRLLWPISRTPTRWSFGPGATVGLSEGQSPNALLGGVMKYEANKNVSVELRFGQWLSGLSPHTNQVRLQANFSF